ncbi:MAG: hypothetical protein ACLFTK_04805 [Anaerolineales bacterium]
MKQSRHAAPLWIFLLVAVLLGLAILTASIEMLPAPPLYPTPTPPEGIDLPNERPVPAR